MIACPIHRRQHGTTLLESLVAIVIFSIGTLAFLAMYARSIAAVSDTQQRTDAAAYSSDLLQNLWLKVQRDSAGRVVASSLVPFAYADSGQDCGQFGTGVAEASVVAPWLARLRNGSRSLPNAGDAGMVQLRIEPDAENRVTITICWRSPMNGLHKHETVAYIN